jgi:hypothetical protein
MEGEEEKLQIDEVGDGEIDEGAISSQLCKFNLDFSS